MAAGRASTLLIRIVGDSTGATTALNQVAVASAAASEVVDESGDKMNKATLSHIKLLEAQHTAEMKNLKLAKISAQQAEQNARDKLRASQLELQTQQQVLKGMKMQEKVDLKAIKLQERKIYLSQQEVIANQRNAASLAAESKAMMLNVQAMERQQREEMDAAIGADATVTANKKKGKSWMGVAGAIAAASAVAIKAAVDLESSTTAVTAIWGEENTAAVMAFAESMEQYGLSTAAAAQASAILGAQLMNAGVPMEEAAKMTEQLITLSVGLANTFNTTVPQALTALSATFRGEYDSIEKYGITINAAAVEAEMLAQQTAGATYATEQQAKVMAVYSLIMQQSTEAMSTVTDTTMTTREAFNMLKASTTNLVAELGGYLLPILTPIFDALGTVVGVTGELIDENGLLAASSDLVTGVLEDLWNIVEPILIPALELLNTVFDHLSDFLEQYVIPVLDRVAQFFETIATAIGNAITAVQNFITELDNLVTWFWENDDAVDAATAAATSMASAFNHTRGVTNRFSVNQQHGPSNQPPNLTINVMAGVGDPHAIAKEIRKVLHRDQVRMGRVA